MNIMDSYKIITDREAFTAFLNWLPELEENEQYYCCLFARKKYCNDVIKSNDKTQLRRFTASSRVHLYRKIVQLEIPIGNWFLKNEVVPQESLVLYIMPNPRNMKTATLEMGKKCWDLINSNNYNLHAEAMSCIQRSKSRTVFVDFDIDTKDVNLFSLKSIFPSDDCYHIIETRGGYHILVDLREVNKYKNDLPGWNWHGAICKAFDVDQSGDQMIPVPGTIQGGFTPRFIELDLP